MGCPSRSKSGSFCWRPTTPHLDRLKLIPLRAAQSWHMLSNRGSWFGCRREPWRRRSSAYRSADGMRCVWLGPSTVSNASAKSSIKISKASGERRPPWNRPLRRGMEVVRGLFKQIYYNPAAKGWHTQDPMRTSHTETANKQSGNPHGEETPRKNTNTRIQCQNYHGVNTVSYTHLTLPTNREV